MNRADHSLDLVQIASPCQADWNAMQGDDRSRYCGQCQKHVYNLSEMSRPEAEKLVFEREGRLCVRFFRRQDGTVLTADCPVCLRGVRRRIARSLAAACGLFMAILGSTALGSLVSRWLPRPAGPPSQAFSEWLSPQTAPTVLVGRVAEMGGCAPPPLITPPTPVHTVPLPLVEDEIPPPGE
jgi:hypothetical protein